jgi:hypothetical protein
MDFVTPDRHTTCEQCHRTIDAFYDEGVRLCCDCLAGRNGGFPKGASAYLPCPLCEPPEIHWFDEVEYCPMRINHDCGRHTKVEESDDVVQVSGLFE